MFFWGINPGDLKGVFLCILELNCMGSDLLA